MKTKFIQKFLIHLSVFSYFTVCGLIVEIFVFKFKNYNIIVSRHYFGSLLKIDDTDIPNYSRFSHLRLDELHSSLCIRNFFQILIGFIYIYKFLNFLISESKIFILGKLICRNPKLVLSKIKRKLTSGNLKIESLQHPFHLL